MPVRDNHSLRLSWKGPGAKQTGSRRGWDESGGMQLASSACLWLLSWSSTGPPVLPYRSASRPEHPSPLLLPHLRALSCVCPACEHRSSFFCTSWGWVKLSELPHLWLRSPAARVNRCRCVSVHNGLHSFEDHCAHLLEGSFSPQVHWRPVNDNGID